MNPLVRDHPRGAVNSGRHPSKLASSSAFVRRPSIRYFDRQLPPDRGPRKNEQIRITPIRLVGAEGEQLGIVPTSQALVAYWDDIPLKPDHYQANLNLAQVYRYQKKWDAAAAQLKLAFDKAPIADRRAPLETHMPRYSWI
jgi:hypothetical protein